MNPLLSEVTQKCDALLLEISQNDIAQLTNYAEYRLSTVGRSGDAGEDIAQSALAAVLQGMHSAQLGRRPRPEDVENKQAFLKYLKRVIISLVHNETKTRKMKSQHTPIADATGTHQDEGAIYLAANTRSPAEQAALDDEQSQLFDKLRQRIPRRLERTMAGWEKVYQESDCIPVDTHRKHRVELRRMAGEAFRELDTNLDKSSAKS